MNACNRLSAAASRWLAPFLIALALSSAPGASFTPSPAAASPATPPTGGQEPAAKPSTNAPESRPTAEAPAPRASNHVNRETPRDAMAGFLDATRHGDYLRAAEYLDLRRLPASARSEEGPTLARQLRVVLDQTLPVDLDALSDQSDGSRREGLPPDRDTAGTIASKSGPVRVLLQRVPEGPQAVWKVSSATMNQVPRLYREFGYGPLGDYLPPAFFEIRVLGLALWQWIGVLALVVLASAFSWLGVAGVVRVLRPFVRRSAPVLGDRFIVPSAGPLRLAVGVLIFYAGSQLLNLSIPARTFFGEIEKALVILIVAWMLLRAVDVLGQFLTEQLVWWGRPSARAVVPLGQKTTKVVIVLIGFLAVLQNVGVNVTGILAGLGIGGLAVALAAQKTVENLFGGITLILDQPVRVGDFCRFGDKLGTVEEIGLRSTRIRTLDRTVISVPNAQFSSLELENFTPRDRIWLRTTIGLRCETTPDQLRYALVEIETMLLAHPMVDKGPKTRLVNLGTSSLDVEIFCYVTTADADQAQKVREDIYLRILDIVAASGTALAVPAQLNYVVRDRAIDPEKRREVEAHVRAWRDANSLNVPDFPEEAATALAGTLDYPPRGSATRASSAGVAAAPQPS
jgi:MscS family membrane protein